MPSWYPKGPRSSHLGPIGLALLASIGAAGCRTTRAPAIAAWPAAFTQPVNGPDVDAPAPANLGPLAPRPERTPARLEEEPYEWKRFGLSLGAQVLAQVNTTLRVDSPTLGIGTEIDLEKDFDVDESVFMGRIDATWHFTRRQELDFSVFNLAREGTRVIDRDIQIGDVVFPVGSEVSTDFDNLFIKLAYRYAFWVRQRWHAGASIGLHTMDWSTEWKAGTLAIEEDFDFTVPLPVLGVFGTYALSPKLYLNASSEFFGLEYDNFDGFLNNTRLALEHRTFRHVGFGIGLDYFLIDASAEGDNGNLEAEMEYDYLGLTAYLRIY